jgi:hypothetical protein
MNLDKHMTSYASLEFDTKTVSLGQLRPHVRKQE